MVSHHWKRNHGQSHDTEQWELVIGSPELTAFQEALHSVSVLAGFQDTIVPYILSFSEFALFPCSCCRENPVIYCCHRRRRMVRDLTQKKKTPKNTDAKLQIWSDHPDQVLLLAADHFWYQENVPIWGWSSKFYDNPDPSDPEGSWATSSTWQSATNTHIAITESCFSSDCLSFLWKDIAIVEGHCQLFLFPQPQQPKGNYYRTNHESRRHHLQICWCLYCGSTSCQKTGAAVSSCGSHQGRQEGAIRALRKSDFKEMDSSCAGLLSIYRRIFQASDDFSRGSKYTAQLAWHV